MVAQEFIHRADAVAVVRFLHRVPDDHATRPHASGLGTPVVNAIISDERIGEGQHLSREGGIREGFLEPHHARGEDEFTLTDALCAEEPTAVTLAVSGQQQPRTRGSWGCFAMCEDVSRIGKSGLVRTFPRHHRLARPDFNNDWGQNLPRRRTDSLFFGDLLAASARVNHELGVLKGPVQSSTLGPRVKEERKGRHFGVRLLAHRHVVVREAEGFCRHFRSAHDDRQRPIPTDLRNRLTVRDAVHRQMHDRAGLTVACVLLRKGPQPAQGRREVLQRHRLPKARFDGADVLEHLLVFVAPKQEAVSSHGASHQGEVRGDAWVAPFAVPQAEHVNSLTHATAEVAPLIKRSALHATLSSSSTRSASGASGAGAATLDCTAPGTKPKVSQKVRSHTKKYASMMRRAP